MDFNICIDRYAVKRQEQFEYGCGAIINKIYNISYYE